MTSARPSDRMRVIRRLRIGGIVAVAIIAIVAIAQAGLLQWRVATAPPWTKLIEQSGHRRDLTTAVLLRAERLADGQGDASSVGAALGDLQARQARFGDLSGDGARTYADFVAVAAAVQKKPRDAALGGRLFALGTRLSAVYDTVTADYVRRDAEQRGHIRTVLFTEIGVTLAVLGLLWVFVAIPGDRYLRRTLDDLESRRQRFAAMFDHSSEMMAVYETDGRIVRANAAALQALGFGREAVGEHFDLHVAPAARAALAQMFESARAGRAAEGESVFLDVRGREVPVATSLSPVIVRGKVVGVIGTSRDISAMQASEAALLQSRERFRSLFEQSPSAVIGVSIDGIITDANVKAEHLSGYRGEDLVGKGYEIFVAPERRAIASEHVRTMMSGVPMRFEGMMRCKDGTDIVIEADVSPIRVGGEVVGAFVAIRDLTADRALERRLEDKDERVRTLYRLVSSSTDVVTLIAETLDFGARALSMAYGFVVRVEDGILTVVHRHGPGDLLPVGFHMPVTGSIGERLLASPRAYAVPDLTAEPYASELDMRGLPWKCYIGSRIAVNGEPYGVLVFIDLEKRAVPFDPADMDFIDLMSGLIGSSVSREQVHAKLEASAFADALTGVANRRALDDYARRVLAYARRVDLPVAVHYIDLDRFKPVNDRYGHNAGDAVLREVARRLSEVVREQDLLARVGGDEFVVVQGGIANEAAAGSLSRRLAESLQPGIALPDGTVVDVAASFGLAIFPADGETFEVLLAGADAAMLAAKRAAIAASSAPVPPGVDGREGSSAP